MRAFHVVDAFTDRAFSGNPAAVMLLDKPVDPAWMQAVAREMNLSETAFCVTVGERFDLRWFTPVQEVELCGHATLATAHVLWQQGRLAPEERAQFSTLSGPLSAACDGQRIVLDFPATPPSAAPPPAGLLEALGVQAQYVGRSRFDYVVVVEDAALVRSLVPAFDRLRQVEARGVMVTAPSDVSEFDFVSRFFAPREGINEDPVTGSAHCCLGPYWQERLGKADLQAYQASSRGGRLGVSVRGDRVLLAGQAVTVSRGEILARLS
jgi:PhzF family phenazine biosynthesis protein